MKTTFGRRGLSLFLALVLCLTLVPAVFAADPVYDITLTPGGSQSLTVGDTLVLTVTVQKDGAGHPVDAADIGWSSSDTAVASVAGGTVTALKAGTTTITASYTPPDETGGGTPDPVTASCTVTVNAAVTAPTSLEVKFADDVTELDMVARDRQTLAAIVTALPAGAEFVESRASFEWRSSNNSVVSISPNGKSATILAEAAGEATITLTVRYPGTPNLNAFATCKVYVSPKMDGVSLNSYSGTIDVSRQVEVKATPNPDDALVSWTSSDTSVATVGSTDPTGRVAVIHGLKPGKATITATIGSGDNTEKAEYSLTVSGLVIDADNYPVVKENGTELLPVVHRYGAAANGTLSWQSSNPGVAQISGSSIAGRGYGTATITAYAGTYEASFNVSVSNDSATTIMANSIRSSGTLRFDDYLSDIAAQAPGGLSHVTGLNVPTAQGTLYYRYTSSDEPNEGVAQNGIYYYRPGTGQKGLSDITFVPNPTYGGGTVTIAYTVVSKTNQNYSCRIQVEVEPEDNADIALTATNYDPARFSSDQFNKICQRETGAALDYVIFSLPPARQGTLYADFVTTDNYGEKVAAGAQYRRKDLDNIAFVPADGFIGTATIYYTGRSVGTRGGTFSGKVIVNVTRENQSGGSGDLYYNVSRGGTVTFDDADFNSYCRSVLSSSSTLSYIRFDSLPSSSQGTLCYNYRSASSPGSQVNSGESYYYGTRNPRLDRVTFEPTDSFTGMVRIPFTGWDTNGNRFSGYVEINVRGGAGSGDIRYTCGSGRSVTFDVNDFTGLCRDLTDSTLNYIRFQSLPDRNSEGAVYCNSTRATVGTRYNRSGSNLIRNLSFRAASSFTGEVDIPFEGVATNGETFNGVVTVEAVDYGDESIRYTATTKDPAVFDRDDFDDASQYETQRNVSSVKFEIPASSRGDLYQNYRSATSKGTRITSSNTSISASSLDRVAFIPASGFTGTVYIDFTATAASSGGTFTGTVEITVERPDADVTVRYSTKVSPVNFRAEDFRRSGYTLNSIQFGSAPSSSQGHLYYRYTSPTQYDRQVNTSSVYNVSGSSLISDLTFVPRAGYTGTVTIPYTGTNSNKTTFEGEVVITVSPTYSSAYFSDLSGYTDQQRAAVDYLYEAGVTNGVTATQYGPQQNISRGDFALMIYRAFQFSPTSASYFSDVPSSAYYAQAVNTLHSMGIVNGVGSGTYAPRSPVTRQDAICMVQRALRYIGWSSGDGYTGNLSNYSDGGSVAGYAQEPMAYAVMMGYLPLSGNQLAPRTDLTRIDMAQILHRVLTY